jgi:hypothetical protein
MKLAIQFTLQSQIHFSSHPNFLVVQPFLAANQQAHQSLVGHSQLAATGVLKEKSDGWGW